LPAGTRFLRGVKMKKPVIFALLVFAGLSGWLGGQTEKYKLNHLTFYDKLREPLFDGVVGFNETFQIYLDKKGLAKIPLRDATIEDISKYRKWLWSQLKFSTLKLGGELDIAGENGTTFSLNPGVSFELSDICNFINILGEINAGIKRDNKVTSSEVTVGLSFNPPEMGRLTVQGKLGLGAKFPGGGDPSSFIGNVGPAISVKLSNKTTIEGNALFYWAAKPVFSDGDTKKKHDIIMSISITYTFASKKGILASVANMRAKKT